MEGICPSGNANQASYISSNVLGLNDSSSHTQEIPIPSMGWGRGVERECGHAHTHIFNLGKYHDPQLEK